MAIVRAFKGFRPKAEMISKVAALPYDVLSSDEAREKVSGNKYSFLHVDKAEVDLDKNINVYDDRVYDKARENLDKFMKEIYVKDETPCMYIYRQEMGDRSQTGLIGCTAIDDYINDVIKKHEFTRSEKELDRIKHIDRCNANTNLMFLTYKKDEKVSDIILEWSSKEPLYDFVSEDGNRHIVWIIDNPETVSEIQNVFKGIDYLYIADGHHRVASSAKVGELRRQQAQSYTGEEEFNYFLSILYPDNEVKILDYNRVIKDLNGLEEGEFLNKIEENFNVIQKDKPVKPSEKHSFGMYINNKWYELKAKEQLDRGESLIDKLDVSILQNNILRPILGIDDPRTSDRIEFIGGSRGLSEIEKRANTDMKVGFSMFPTTIEEVITISNSGGIMPPKSTWFEPKPLCGIIIHKLD